MNKTVFITGITSGIGEETALKFLDNGWNVLGQYCASDDKAKELEDRIKESGGECRLFKADLSSEDGIKALIEDLKGEEIESLVNNAGTYVVSEHFSELKLDTLTKTFMVNVFAPAILSSAVFEGMKKKGFGRIVNVSSIAAKYGGSSLSMHYGSSKRALEGITKTMARDGAGCNVLVNTVRPGVIDTEFHKKFPKDMTKRVEMIPARRMGTPSEVADLIYYLGSEINTFITNDIVTIAGGE